MWRGEDETCKRRVRPCHQEMLIGLMEKNLPIALASSRSRVGLDHSKKMWDVFARSLNQIGGLYRSGKAWCRYWTDWKFKVRRKYATIRKCQFNNTPCPLKLTPQERRVVAILTDDEGNLLPTTSLNQREDPAFIDNGFHISLPSDMENYMQYKVMGSVKKIKMKKGCVPSKFYCQPGKIRRTKSLSSQSEDIVRLKTELVKECSDAANESGSVDTASTDLDISELKTADIEKSTTENSQDNSVSEKVSIQAEKKPPDVIKPQNVSVRVYSYNRRESSEQLDDSNEKIVENYEEEMREECPEPQPVEFVIENVDVPQRCPVEFDNVPTISDPNFSANAFCKQEILEEPDHDVDYTRDKKSIEELRRDLVEFELNKQKELFEIEKLQRREKHSLEMAILELRKQILMKELNKL